MSSIKRSPESEMMSYGYEPAWSEGSVKAPIFQTSTFVFRTAEEGKKYFELAYGLRDADQGESSGLIYSRLNHPNMEILENRLALWEEAESATVHDSGMAAITTAILTFLKPGGIILHGYPLYGGTAHFFSAVLPEFQIHCVPFTPSDQLEDVLSRVHERGLDATKIGMIYLETPANPTNDLFDLFQMMEWRETLKKRGAETLLAVDNTYMGPLWQKPILLGADLSIYSATKYLNGHSDLIAGAILGSAELIRKIKVYRTFLGNAPAPHTCWLLLRSLETLKIRMEAQQANAIVVAEYLRQEPFINAVSYLGLDIQKDDNKRAIYNRQLTGSGAMISFEVPGKEQDAFNFLNQLRLIKLAVSLGSTESLAQHPATMTHASMPEVEKLRMGITPTTIRLSIGLENPTDLINDIKNALVKMNQLTMAS